MVVTLKSCIFAVLFGSNLLYTKGFLQRTLSPKNAVVSSGVPSIAGSINSHHPRSSVLLMGKLWDRMEIEEDEETMWYVLNCVAGLEMDLLRQCRARCDDMEDVEKFVVPTETTTRSHGPNRMVQDTKVKYQGYVFAKLRLCPKTYETIQDLDLCRSWMGTVNQKGHKKLPPAPVALNEIEIENFGLEDLETPDDDDEEEEDGIIVDNTDDEEKIAAAIEKEVQDIYKGLRVGDMIKVTAKNKFFDEDGIVKRLKGKQIFVRFYTYGSVFDEWLDPTEVRKLDEVEAIKGLSGPSQPITQRDIDGPQQGDRGSRFGRDGDRRNLANQLGGGSRDRPRDRAVSRFSRNRDQPDSRKERDSWNWYKDNELRNEGKGFQDGEYDMRGSSERSNDAKGRWAQGDVDSQWGRTSQRQNRRDKKSTKEDDWSSFVSPASKKPNQAETDDFFASLMTDLSKDLDAENKQEEKSSKSDSSSSEDDFFASLMSEISEDEPATPSSKSNSDDDDFFASLEFDLDEGDNKEKKSAKSSSSTASDDDLDDFFADLAAEVSEEKSQKNRAGPKKATQDDDLESFFDDLVMETEESASSSDDPDDFFAGLEAELESELKTSSAEVAVEEKPAASSRTPSNQKPSNSEASQDSSSSSAGVDLQKCTVPVLKDMLRNRGLKVSGKKSELIERLQQV